MKDLYPGRMCAACGRLFNACVLCGNILYDKNRGPIPNVCKFCYLETFHPVILENQNQTQTIELLKAHFRKLGGLEYMVEQLECENRKLKHENRKLRNKLRRKKQDVKISN
jgi:hypothetical protein